MSDYLAAPTKLRVWKVSARRADGVVGPWVPTFHVPAYTEQEAAAWAMAHSGIADHEKGYYLFTPTYEGET